MTTVIAGPADSGKSELGLFVLGLKETTSSLLFLPLADMATCDNLRQRIEGVNIKGVPMFENTNGVLQCKSNPAHSSFIFVDDLHLCPQHEDASVRGMVVSENYKE